MTVNVLFMNEDIKEMIQNRIEDIYQSGEYIYQAKELEEILNYITNLQKENEQLRTEQNTYINTIKEVNKECNSLFNHLTKKDLDYKQRNEKAVEYLLNNKLYMFKYDDEELFEITTDKKAKDDLLNILKGAD